MIKLIKENIDNDSFDLMVDFYQLFSDLDDYFNSVKHYNDDTYVKVLEDDTKGNTYNRYFTAEKYKSGEDGVSVKGIIYVSPFGRNNKVDVTIKGETRRCDSPIAVAEFIEKKLDESMW